MRPKIPLSACPPNLVALIEQCWDENPSSRPTFSKVRDVLHRIIGKEADNIVDHLLRTLDQQTIKLEAEATLKLCQFAEERQRSEDLLSQILPKYFTLAK